MGQDAEHDGEHPLRIALVGPAEPRAFAQYFDPVTRAQLPTGLGGVPVNELGRALVDAGHHVVLITSSRDIEQPMSFSGAGLHIEVHPYRSRARDRALDFFRRERAGVAAALGAHEVDVIHAHWTYEYAWGALGTGTPLVVTAHDSPFTILRWQPNIYRLIRLVMAWRVRLSVRHLTAVSPYLARRWRSTMLFRREIAVVPNIAPFEPAVPAATASHSLAVVDVTDASRLKNVTTLIAAFALVRQEAPDATLTLIGGGLGVDGGLAHWATARGIEVGIRFLGPASRVVVAEELKAADVLAHTSREESQGIILLEAMAHNLAIIGGRTSGGVPWTLGDGAAGALVDVSSPRSVADAIVAFNGRVPSQDPHAYAARTLLETRFSVDAVRDAYVATYRRAIAAGG